jgi:hypothetical protein
VSSEGEIVEKRLKRPEQPPKLREQQMQKPLSNG